ncbi:23S rRNA (adenine(2503)-C(2))-methyltransferase RlmN [Selenomonas sp. oral taxon 136]|uniref:23S rRNA (adenine(2503)-C(2))-methyltransferase RlmN n=1 Tax=Selenomonas sp. oral taxon 136 TaxID=713030 RepID=UPI000767E0EE|nr:23S rRNA (adenine(2503)-C(2))-methyltransferase RlmN [Selenomonas sp. oral taxon 136]AME02864.1 23S rRNA (adenine(2503)-C2)-methyltransferase [Selenomonas sp. oral taxon 136]
MNIFGWTKTELADALREEGIPRFRADQIIRWMYQRGAVSFDVMDNLPKLLRAQLAERFSIERPQVGARLTSADGATIKLLYAFADGQTAETVLMRHPYGNSVCVSTQAGCRMGCAFCASTLHGLARNLTVGEIAAQVIGMADYLRQEGARVDTIVVMGSGEPMENYDNVIGALRLLHAEETIGLSYRGMTLSTSGIVPGILRLAEEGLPISLSISLHAPTEELRSSLMPVNRMYPMAEVLRAAELYAARTKRRVTYEYILIRDVNDGVREAEQLARLLRGQLASVNLIPINPVVERNLLRPSKGTVRRFQHVLEERHITATVRREMGTDIQAACGQLRSRLMDAGL